MHEASIADSMVALVVDQLDAGGALRGRAGGVSSVRVRVGELSGVVPEALRFAFDAAAVGTIVEGARLEVEEVKVAVWCPRCETERTLATPPQRLRCPACDARTPEVRRGRELELVSVEVVDDAPDRGSPPADPQEK